MKDNGQLHAQAALSLEKEPPVPIDEAERTPELAWMFWRRETFLDNCKIESGLSVQWPRRYTDCDVPTAVVYCFVLLIRFRFFK